MEPQQLSLFDAPAAETADIEAQAGCLADSFLHEMEREGLDHAAQQQVLMELQIRTLIDGYLMKLPPGHRWQFAVRLIEAINQLEGNSHG